MFLDLRQIRLTNMPISEKDDEDKKKSVEGKKKIQTCMYTPFLQPRSLKILSAWKYWTRWSKMEDSK